MARILVLGGDTDFNLGDKAILVAVCEALAALDPGHRVVVCGRSQPGSLPSNVAKVLPRGPAGLPAAWMEAGRSDLLLISGGGLFQDDDSRIKMPYWAARLAALRTANSRIAGLAIGAGPLTHIESRLAARWASSMMSFVSVRDEFARTALQPCTAQPVSIVPDPAFMLRPAAAKTASAALRAQGVPTDRPLLGIALRRWFHPLGGFVPHRVRTALGLGRDAGAQDLTACLAEIATAVTRIAKRLDADVLMMPTYTAPHENDVDVCTSFRNQLRGVETHQLVCDDPAVYKAIAGRLSLMISARMHPLILAAGGGVPIVGMAYNGKFGGLFGMLGLPERYLWLRDFPVDPQAFGSRLARLADDALADTTELAECSTQLGNRTRDAIGRIVASGTAPDGLA